MFKKDPIDKRMHFIWPKDGPRGRKPRGFFGGLSDIMANKGPDIFIQKGNSKEAIKPDHWGNWDSYHDPEIHRTELANAKPLRLGGRSRGFKRYDPHTRKYKTWDMPVNWGGDWYPRFTEDEWEMGKTGSDWNEFGPMRFRPEYNYFWGHAHRIGENLRNDIPIETAPCAFYRFHQTRPDEVRSWVNNHPST